MSEGSRFASLSRRAAALLGSGAAAPVAVLTTEAPDGGATAAETLEVIETPASPPPPSPPPPPPPAAIEEGELLAVDDPSHPAFANGVAAANQRVTDVFASDASNGKERVAASLLADSDMSAEKIVALLPKLGADASDSMLKTLAETKNPDLKPGSETRTEPKAEANSVWDRTFERAGWNK